MSGVRAKSLAERFWPKVDVRGADECWTWLAATNEHGYGVMRPVGKRTGPTIKAHRVSLILAGADPGDLSVLHSCDNPPCVNPKHLRVGTQAENIAEMHARGRGNRGSRNGATRLTDQDVLGIRERVAAGESQASLCREYELSPSAMSQLVNGHTWKHVAIPPGLAYAVLREAAGARLDAAS